MAGDGLRDSEIERFMFDSNYLDVENSVESDLSEEDCDRVTREQLENSDNYESEEEYAAPDIRSAMVMVADEINHELMDIQVENQGRPLNISQPAEDQGQLQENRVRPTFDHDSIETIIDLVASGELGGLDNQYIWDNVPNLPYNLIFQGENVGVNIPNSENLKSELDVFLKFCNNDLFDILAIETNKFAQKCFSDPNRKKLKDDTNWVEVTTDEIKSFLALTLIMSVVRKPTLQTYWSKRKIIETKVFTEVMSLKRFQAIMRFLHFSNDDNTDVLDKLKKIRPIISYYEKKFMDNYTPDQNMSVDESLMKFRGRLSYVQFNRCKRARFGVKFFKLCESKSGYCSAFEIYTGKTNTPKGVLVSEEIVLKLVDPFLDKGYILHIDNWYSSPVLYSKLLDRMTYAVGTVKMNRKYMPTHLTSYNLQKGEAARCSANGILAVRWMDRKAVNVISTKHCDIDFQPTGKRARPSRTAPGFEICKPQSIIDYNNGMLAVDRQDQVLAYNPIMRRYAKGYKKIFFYLFEMAIFNSFVVFIHLNGKKQAKSMQFSDFKANLAEQIIETVVLPNKAGKGRPSLTNPLRLQGRHFPMTIPATDKKEFPSKRCVVCHKHGLRKEVRVQCKQCSVPLHMDICFEAYHTAVNY